MRQHPLPATRHRQPRRCTRSPGQAPTTTAVSAATHAVPCLVEPGPTPDVLNFKDWLAEGGSEL